jgi:hypothetical protein
MKSAFRICIALAALSPLTAVSEEPRQAPPAKETKVHQTDRFGNVQYHKPSYAVQQDGKVMQADQYGSRLQQQYEIEGDRVYTTDKYGNRSGPSFVVQGDKVHQTDKYGNVQYHEPSYAVQPDGKVTEVDSFGNRGQQKSEIRGDRPGQTKAVDGKASPESVKK